MNGQSSRLPGHLIFYDIETTGLSGERNQVYLIGAMSCKPEIPEREWEVKQWFAKTPETEEQILREFLSWLERTRTADSLLVQYNGTAFDEPFLTARCAFYGIPCGLAKLPSLDLYREIRPLKSFLGLKRLKQTDLEAFLGLEERKSVDGKACVRLYQKYIRESAPPLRQILLKHNEEDVSGLRKASWILRYYQLLEDSFTVEEAQMNNGLFRLAVRFPEAFPVPVEAVFPTAVPRRSTDSISRPDRSGNDAALFPEKLILKEETAVLLSPLREGKLRLFYPDFKNYDYSPDEDCAIPKSISAFLAKKRRIPATRDTCYTWFDCSEAFLQSPKELKRWATGQFSRIV